MMNQLPIPLLDGVLYWIHSAGIDPANPVMVATYIKTFVGPGSWMLMGENKVYTHGDDITVLKAIPRPHYRLVESRINPKKETKS
jgi:hypothetical protein